MDVEHHLAALADPDGAAAPAQHPVRQPVRPAVGEGVGEPGLDVGQVLGVHQPAQVGSLGGPALRRRRQADHPVRLGVPEGLAGDQVALEGAGAGRADGEREQRVRERRGVTGGRGVGTDALGGAGARVHVVEQVGEPVRAGLADGLQHVQVAPGHGAAVGQGEREDADRLVVDDHRQGHQGDHAGAHSGVAVGIVDAGALGAEQVGAAQSQGHRGGQVAVGVDGAVALVGPVGQAVGRGEPEHPGGVDQVERAALAGDPGGALGEDGAEQFARAGALQQ